MDILTTEESQHNFIRSLGQASEFTEFNGFEGTAYQFIYQFHYYPIILGGVRDDLTPREAIATPQPVTLSQSNADVLESIYTEPSKDQHKAFISLVEEDSSLDFLPTLCEVPSPRHISLTTLLFI